MRCGQASPEAGTRCRLRAPARNSRRLGACRGDALVQAEGVDAGKIWAASDGFLNGGWLDTYGTVLRYQD